MTTIDFDLWFTYVLVGWEGTPLDALVLRDSLKCENGLRVPQGNRVVKSILFHANFSL